MGKGEFPEANRVPAKDESDASDRYCCQDAVAGRVKLPVRSLQ